MNNGLETGGALWINPDGYVCIGNDDAIPVKIDQMEIVEVMPLVGLYVTSSPFDLLV